MNNTKLESNIISIFGQKGKVWLDDLPYFIQKSASKFGLEQLKGVLGVNRPNFWFVNQTSRFV